MKRIFIVFAVLSLISASALAQRSPSAAAERLANLINSYRVELGLEAIPISKSLTLVAEEHASDLGAATRASECNMHSWSAAGKWTPCCYTSDHAQAQCMWVKPREITDGVYAGFGYEISYGGGGGVVTPEGALRSWKSSPGHHEVIISKGIWSSSRWRAMGVAVTNGYALVWFGKEADPAK